MVLYSESVIIAHKCNSYQEIDQAINKNIKILEIDVRMCNTGELIIYHDTEIELTNKIAYIENTQGHTLIKMGFLTLQDIIKHIGDRAQIILDIKTPFMQDSKLIINSLSNLIKDHKEYFTNNVVLSSFNHQIIKNLKEMFPEIKRSIITSSVSIDGLKDAIELECSYMQLQYDIICKNMMEEAYNNNIKVMLYTVNTTDTINKFNKDGLVYGIITDNYKM